VPDEKLKEFRLFLGSSNKTEEEIWCCPYCGYHNSENDRFCFECGEKNIEEDGNE